MQCHLIEEGNSFILIASRGELIEFALVNLSWFLSTALSHLFFYNLRTGIYRHTLGLISLLSLIQKKISPI